MSSIALRDTDVADKQVAHHGMTDVHRAEDAIVGFTRPSFARMDKVMKLLYFISIVGGEFLWGRAVAVAGPPSRPVGSQSRLGLRQSWPLVLLILVLVAFALADLR